MWIKISPEQGHAARTHTPPGAHTSQALSGCPAPCASRLPLLLPRCRPPSTLPALASGCRRTGMPAPLPAHRGMGTRRFRAGCTSTHSGAGEDIFPCRDREVHTCTQSWHAATHTSQGHTWVPVHRPHARRRVAAPTAFGTHTEAKRHYGRHSLGFVLLIVSTGLNVSGQFYLHIAE